MKQKQIWVDPEFHKFLKIKSAKENKSIMDITKELSKSLEDNKKKKNVFFKI